ARLMVERGFSPLFYITSRAEKKRHVFRQLEGVAFCTHDSMELVMTDPEEEYGDVVFQKKIQPEKKIIAVLEVGDLSREIIDPGLFSDHSLLLIGGQQYPRERMIEQLFEMKYERKEHVREKGDLAIRGEILDVFPPQLDAPIRTYWMGNVIEKIKYFLPDTQRTTDSIDRCLLIPREGTFKTFPFLGLLKEKAGILFWDDVLIENQDLASIPQVISGIITPQGPTTTFQFPAERPPSFQGDISSLLSFLKQDSGNTVYIVLPGEKGKNLASILQEEKISYSREISGEPRIIQLDGFPCEGFVCDELGMTLLSHREIFGKDILKPGKRKPETRSPEEVIRSLQEGDFVVHEDQGIGIFRGMKEIVVEGVHRVYLVIEYAAGDILYVPVDHVKRGTLSLPTPPGRSKWSSPFPMSKRRIRKRLLRMSDMTWNWFVPWTG
ncbi:MAG: hypothetical protein NTX88_00680, partial [Candidatus Atribacteria bacterium]|nr:hypothetical protein [Candidatus Atribacteria bacterium]